MRRVWLWSDLRCDLIVARAVADNVLMQPLQAFFDVCINNGRCPTGTIKARSHTSDEFVNRLATSSVCALLDSSMHEDNVRTVQTITSKQATIGIEGVSLKR